MSHTPWMENDALARQQMEIGWEWQSFTKDFFESKNLEVNLPDFAFRKSVEKIKDFEDEPDLFVEKQRIEVKSRGLTFTEDPNSFPYDRAIVDTKSSYEHYESKPIAYVFISQETKAMLWTPAGFDDQGRDISSRWQIQTLNDHVRDINDQFYLVRKDELRPISLLVDLLSAVRDGEIETDSFRLNPGRNL